MNIKLALIAVAGLSLLAGVSPTAASPQDARLNHATPAGTATNIAAAAPKETLIARRHPASLLQSTGNLYWTVNTENEFSANDSSVYRTAKTGGPSRVLYRETGSRHFGALAYAKVGGIWYGYVAAMDAGSFGKARVQRFLLDGGGQGRTVFQGNSTITGMSTDSASLYFSDAVGIHALSLVGNGRIRTLVTGVRVDQIGLAGTTLFYSTGRTINYVSLTTGRRTLLATATTRITALHATLNQSGVAYAYWGEYSGRVARQGVVGGVTTFQGPQSGRRISSVSFDGARVLWSDCSLNGLECAVRARGRTQSTISIARGFVFAVQGDLTRTFWAAPEGLKSYTR